MTRELKLALIIAVTLVLSVMVLISDHLAVQRRPKLAEVNVTQPLGTPPPPVAEPPVTAPKEPAVGEPSPTTVPAMRMADGRQPAETGLVPASEHGDLAKAVELQGGTVENGVVKLPTFAGNTTEPITDVIVNTGVPQQTETRFQTSPLDPVEIVQGMKTKDSATPVAGGKTHIVAPGDTAYKLARVYLGDGKYWKKIVDANPKAFGGNGQIKVGTQLVIPSAGAPAPAKAAPASPDAKPSPTRVAVGGDKSVDKAKSKVAKAYTIRKGDTLHSIAKRELGSSGRVDEIMRLNKGVIKDPTTLPLGVAIALPGDDR